MIFFFFLGGGNVPSLITMYSRSIQVTCFYFIMVCIFHICWFVAMKTTTTTKTTKTAKLKKLFAENSHIVSSRP